ncbi:MAG: SWIM zinc finger family protein, partial [Marinoscillum sp.]
MSIQAFLKEIPPVILSRGKEYFQDGAILDLSTGEDGEWYAEVEGTYGVYEVVIEVDKTGNVSQYSCDCPYDGAICKHVAAVALEINENQNIEVSTKEPDQNKWTALIKAAKTDDLRKFMLDFGKRDKDFRYQIELTFSKPSENSASSIAYYQQQIKGIFDHYDYSGYLDYRSSREAVKDVDEFLNKAQGYLNKGFLNEAFRIAAAISMEGVEAIKNMDDSSGDCGEAINESFALVQQVFHETESPNLKEQIFGWLQEQVQNDDYHNYGASDQLLPLFMEVAIHLSRLEPAYQFVSQKLKEAAGESDWYKKYYTQLYLKYQIDLLTADRRMEEVDQVIDSNLHFEEFRKMRVEQSLSQGEVTRAEKLILDGIEIAQNDNSLGIVHQWEDQLLAIYHQHGMIEKYNALAKKLFLAHSSSLDYFKAYKKTSPEKEWDERRNQLITELSKQKLGHYGFSGSLDLANLYVEEGMVDDLFELVSASNSIHTLIRYTQHLKEKYSTELLEYYKAAIKIVAEQSGRSVYHSLV